MTLRRLQQGNYSVAFEKKKYQTEIYTFGYFLLSSSSDSELERKKRKAKKALEDLAAAAGLLRGGDGKLSAKADPAPVPPPPYIPTPLSGSMAAMGGGASGDDDDYPGKWRPMALKVKLGHGDDEPEVEESRMVYMKDEKRASMGMQAPVEQEEVQLGK